MTADYYKILGVHPSANADEIRKAYKSKLRTTHPDTGGNAEDFHAVQEAWGTLGDANKKAQYDSPKVSFKSSSPPNSPNFTHQQQQFFYQSGFEEAYSKLQEELFEKQRRDQQHDININVLAQEKFPLKGNRLLDWFGGLYVSSYLWNLDYPMVSKWKKIDLLLSRLYLALAFIIPSIAFLPPIINSSSNQTQASSLILLLILVIGCLVSGVVLLSSIWLYRFITYYVKPRVKKYTKSS